MSCYQEEVNTLAFQTSIRNFCYGLFWQFPQITTRFPHFLISEAASNSTRHFFTSIQELRTEDSQHLFQFIFTLYHKRYIFSFHLVAWKMTYVGRKDVRNELVSVCGVAVLLDMKIKNFYQRDCNVLNQSSCSYRTQKR